LEIAGRDLFGGMGHHSRGRNEEHTKNVRQPTLNWVPSEYTYTLLQHDSDISDYVKGLNWTKSQS